MEDLWTDRLSEYLDGELDPAERVQLEEHLAGCEQCTSLLAELDAVRDRARGLGDRPLFVDQLKEPDLAGADPVRLVENDLDVERGHRAKPIAYSNDVEAGRANP